MHCATSAYFGSPREPPKKSCIQLCCFCRGYLRPMCQPGGTRSANRFERRRCLSKKNILFEFFQIAPPRMKNGRKSSRSFKDGSDFLRTIAPYQQVTSSDASFLGSCAIGVPLSI